MSAALASAGLNAALAAASTVSRISTFFACTVSKLSLCRKDVKRSHMEVKAMKECHLKQGLRGRAHEGRER